MFLSETVNFGVGTALFLHAVFKVAVNYVCNTCSLSPHNGKPADRLKVKTTATQGHSLQLPENLPTVVDIKRVLPKACFESRVSTSMYYLVKDFAQVFLSQLNDRLCLASVAKSVMEKKLERKYCSKDKIGTVIANILNTETNPLLMITIDDNDDNNINNGDGDRDH